MAKKFTELRAGMSQAAREKANGMARQMLAEMPLNELRHTPSTAKREARKIDTQARYASWKKAYKALRKKHPGKSDVWYSQQIAKTAIAKGLSASTIKKNMLA